MAHLSAAMGSSIDTAVFSYGEISNRSCIALSVHSRKMFRNEMTAVNVAAADNTYSISGVGYKPEGLHSKWWAMPTLRAMAAYGIPQVP
jgi:hypothetical protein